MQLFYKKEKPTTPTPKNIYACTCYSSHCTVFSISSKISICYVDILATAHVFWRIDNEWIVQYFFTNRNVILGHVSVSFVKFYWCSILLLVNDGAFVCFLFFARFRITQDKLDTNSWHLMFGGSLIFFFILQVFLYIPVSCVHVYPKFFIYVSCISCFTVILKSILTLYSLW